jgi:hypothetical protein
MKHALWLTGVVVITLVMASAPLQAQTRADSAAVLLHTAEQLRQRGEGAAARTLLAYIERHFADTPSAAHVAAIRAAVRRLPEAERSGRTELMAWGTTYGAWLGIAVPFMAGADEPAPYGLGLLSGAPAGFLAARAYANAYHPTEGQARAITFGSSWGTFQGFGWAEVLNLGQRTVRHDYCDPQWGGCEYEDTDGKVRMAAGVAGGLIGIGTGAVLAQKPITAGTAAVVTSSGMWGTWFGWTLPYIVTGVEDDALLTTTLIAGNASLLGAALLAPEWQMTESRMRLIDVGGLIGGLAGLGLTLIVQPDSDRTIIALPVIGSAVGLLAGVHLTRDHSAPEADGAGRGALLNLDGGRWALDMPDPGLTVQRVQGDLRPAAYVPLVRARF